MYRPIWKDHFRDAFELTDDGKFRIDSKDPSVRRMLALHINDNVYKNMEKVSV